MRKSAIFAMILSLFVGVSMAQACGNKKASAEATKAKAEMTKAGSSCSSKTANAAVSPAAVKIEQTVEKVGAGDDCCAHATSTEYKHDAAMGGCPYSSKAGMEKAATACPYESHAKMQKAAVEKINAKDKSCSASSACSAKSLRDGNTKATMKTEKKNNSRSDGMASTSNKAPSEASTLK